MIIAITQQKGGTGKTTTAHALGAGLSRRGGRVLFVDLDPQGNLTYTLGGNQAAPGTLELLARGARAEQVIQHAPGGDVIGTNQLLASLEFTWKDRGRETRLKRAIAPISVNYDHIIIDTPPALGVLAINAITAADRAIIPCTADIYSIQATAQIAETMAMAQSRGISRARLAGLLLTRFHCRQILSTDIAAQLATIAGQLDTRLFSTRIRECVALREAQANRTDIFAYSPRSNGAKDYNQLTEEILADGN